jgi:hypothetical protein
MLKDTGVELMRKLVQAIPRAHKNYIKT